MLTVSPVLKKRLDELRPEYVAEVERSITARVQRFLDLYAAAPPGGGAWGQRQTLRRQFKDMRKFVVQPSRNGIVLEDSYALAPDATQRIAADAEAIVTAACTEFLARVGAKLEGFALDSVDGQISLRGAIPECRLMVNLVGGGKFLLQLQIVTVFGRTTKSGEAVPPYYQFPTTFQNVYLADGSKLKGPSEAKVRSAFIKAAA